MAAILADVGPGDEVIMPSFTFVSTANAFVLRGAVPVFVDVRPDTLNLDEDLVEAAITAATRAIVPVHYAGVGCEMDGSSSSRGARARAHRGRRAGAHAPYRGRPLGARRPRGAKLPRDEERHLRRGRRPARQRPALVERAEIVHEKGTNREQFFRGQVDKYTWVDIGSSYPPSEINAAFLWAQLEDARAITSGDSRSGTRYHVGFARARARAARCVDRSSPPTARHNAPLYYLLLPAQARTRLIARLTERRGPGGLPLRPAALLAGRPPLRPRRRAVPVTDDAQRTTRPPPALAGPRASRLDRIVEAVHGALAP